MRCVRIGSGCRSLATELGDNKWQYRALAQLGVAAFYNGDLATAGKNVSQRLGRSYQKRRRGPHRSAFLTTLGIGLHESHMNEEATDVFRQRP